jgi:hypothetical protein
MQKVYRAVTILISQARRARVYQQQSLQYAYNPILTEFDMRVLLLLKRSGVKIADIVTDKQDTVNVIFYYIPYVNQICEMSLYSPPKLFTFF